MAKTKLVHVKLNDDNVGNFFGRDSSGVVAMRQGKKDVKKLYGTFKGFIKGKFYSVILALEEKENKEGKKYHVGSNKGFAMSFYDDADKVTHVTLYGMSTPRKATQKRSYVQTNRKYEQGRKRYGKDSWNIRNDF